MEQRRKRKLDDAVCIIHIKDAKNDDFTFIKNTKDPDERFRHIQNIKQRRLSQQQDSPYRLEEICSKIPDTFSENHGYHRSCYTRFIGNLQRLTDSDAEVPSSSMMSTRRSSTFKNKDNILFHPDCIFCRHEGRKKVKVKGLWTSEDTKYFERGGGETIVKYAEAKEDYKLLRRISGFNLFSCEAKYHPSCRRNYCNNPDKWRSKCEENIEEQAALEKAHKESFEKVCQAIREIVIAGRNVLHLSDLRAIYVSHLEKTPFPNSNYRGDKLKLKLEKWQEFQGLIGFCHVRADRQFTSYIVYSLKMDIGEAIKSSYQLGQKDNVTEVAELIRTEILKKFQETGEMTWPLTVNDLNLSSTVIPNVLEHFLTRVITGGKPASRRTIRLVSSVGQDICRAVTNGSWKLPKHVVLGMALRHMFRSAELIIILNRLGHCENYSFLLELETAIVVALENTSSLLPLSIIRNPSCPSLFHSDFDNFDEFVNDMCGAGSVHRSHGIMLQEILVESGENTGGTQPELSSTVRTGHRSLHYLPDTQLPDIYIGKRKSPELQITRKYVDGGSDAYETNMKKNFLWILIRLHCAKTGQEVPGWGGHVSLTGEVPTRLTTIEYYPIIPHPITDIKAVAECLRYSEEASNEVGQEYVITTFDLGVCMKAYPLIWAAEKRYEKHIVMIGTFHLVCAYLKMLGKKMEGTGFSDILIEAGLISSGSLNGVISAKNYSRSLHCHKTALEALERLILSVFLEKKGETVPFTNLPKVSKDLIANLISNTNKETEQAVLNEPHLTGYIDGYEKFRDDIRSGEYGKTAILWISYMDHVWLALSLLQAVKTNNFAAYRESLCLMPDLFFSFGGQNYARYLTFFSMFIANIEQSHPGSTDLLTRGAMSVARSFVPGSRSAVDKTIEETFMKHSKSRGGSGSSGAGLTGLQTNFNAYQRWAKSAKERAKFLLATYSLADLIDDHAQGNKHRDLRPAEKRRGEKQVTRTMAAITSFNNPFDISDQETLYCISSGAPASALVAYDVLQAEAAGLKAKEEFIQERLEKKTDFFEPIKRLNLKTMASMHKSVKLATSKNKIVEYKQQSNVAFKLLVKSQQLGNDEKLNLEKLMAFELTPVPFSLGSADGFLAKNDKSTGRKYIAKGWEESSLPTNPEECLVIIDGNAVFHSLKEVPGNFGEIGLQILGSAVRKSVTIFSTDMYQDDSIKSVERIRRGCGEKLIVSGLKTRRPRDWKLFLQNEDNKKQLVNILLTSWKSDSSTNLLHGHEVILICEGQGYQFTSDGKTTSCQEVPTLMSTQEETDSRVILYCMYAKERGFKTIRVQSPDTDILFILLHYANQLDGLSILFETGKGSAKCCIDVTGLAKSLTPKLCSALLGAHAYSGCDSTSAFKGKGKVKAIKLIQNSEAHQTTFARLGESWDIEDSLFSDVERFTCRLYGNCRITKVNQLRYISLQSKCGGKGSSLKKSSNVDLSSLPPCQSSLQQHIRRVNYQVGIWKRAHIYKPNIPSPISGHGWTVEDGVMQPKWMEGDMMPQELIDILEETIEETDSESESDCDVEDDNLMGEWSDSDSSSDRESEA